MPSSRFGSLDLSSLRARCGRDPEQAIDVIDDVLARINHYADPALFTCLLSRREIMPQVGVVESRRRRGEPVPLYGVPFVVKDNIDVAGIPTTAACPAYAYTPSRSATVVQRLQDAGAIVIAKTNLDQFATGLVGTRSPYGVPRNTFHPDYIPGGSSSGSGAAVAAGLVTFALGTDTAGSGRVPAAFNNIVGLKPTKGRLSTAGVVPACRSLDCVSIFSLTCSDAAEILRIAEGADAEDPFSREDFGHVRPIDRTRFTFGVPSRELLEFFGDSEMENLFHAVSDQLRHFGGERMEIDFAPFVAAAKLLYEGPWVAERYVVVRDLLNTRPETMLEVTRKVIARGANVTAAATFEGFYELQRLRALSEATWAKVDLLLLPTTGTIYTKAQVAADPVQLNTNLGYYTNFVNLLDLCGIAIPAGFRANGLPGGVTLMAPAGADEDVLAIAGRLQQQLNLPLGATGHPLPSSNRPEPAPKNWIELAVMGAHLSGLPLNHQLTSRGAQLIRTARTSASYQFFALPGTVPPKPGMVRCADGQGGNIEVEIWALSPEAFGNFVTEIPSPLGIGTITLEDGASVKSFLCEAIAVTGAQEITRFGGWRAFLKRS